MNIDRKSTYQVTLQSQLFILKEIGIRSLVLVVGMIVVVHFRHGEYWADILFAFELSLIIIALDAIPCAVLHYQYYNHDKGVKLGIDGVTRTITLEGIHESHLLHFDEIESIRIVLAGELFDGAKRGWYALEQYHYAVIETKNNKRFIITCLLLNDLRNVFSRYGLTVNWERRGFPLLSREKTKSADGW